MPLIRGEVWSLVSPTEELDFGRQMARSCLDILPAPEGEIHRLALQSLRQGRFSFVRSMSLEVRQEHPLWPKGWISVWRDGQRRATVGIMPAAEDPILVEQETETGRDAARILLAFGFSEEVRQILLRTSNRHFSAGMRGGAFQTGRRFW